MLLRFISMLAQKDFLRFCRCRRGNVIIFVGLAALILVGAVGVVIDMSRAQILKSRMQAALDASNLATGVAYINNCNLTKTLTQEAQTTCLTQQAQTYFNANFPSNYLNSQPIAISLDLSRLSQGYINVTASTSQTTDIISIMGVSSIPVSVASQITVPVSGATCGTAITGSFSSPGPTSNLCASGNASPVTENTPTNTKWLWSCTNPTSEASVNCTANVASGPAGTCGIESQSTTAVSIAPSGAGLCSVGSTPSSDPAIQSGPEWTWICTGTSGVATDCSAPVPGKCGSLANVPSSTAPVGAGGELCAEGTATPSPVTSSNGQWQWTCTTEPPGTPCTAPVLGVCGSATAAAPSDTPPTTNLCNVGTATPAKPTEVSNQWQWSCNPGSLGTAPTCTAPLPTTFACGSDGTPSFTDATPIFSQSPATVNPDGLCVGGNITSAGVTGGTVDYVKHIGALVHPWQWTCQSLTGGTVSCYARYYILAGGGCNLCHEVPDDVYTAGVNTADVCIDLLAPTPDPPHVVYVHCDDPTEVYPWTPGPYSYKCENTCDK